MKNKLLFAFAWSGIFMSAMAQSTIKTYEACDTDLDGVVEVGDITRAVSHTLTEHPTCDNVVTAEQLNSILNDIYTKLSQLDTKMDQFDNKLSALGTEINKVLEIVDPFMGHEYVDLGVEVNGEKILWATCNVGADNEYDDGYYFAWGETEPKSSYSIDTYKWCNGTRDTMTKYCTDSNYGDVDNKIKLELEDDAASKNWKGIWRTPTYEELNALINQCNWRWIKPTTDNGFGGKAGVVISNKNNANYYIFIPAAGYYGGNRLYYWNQGSVWTSTLDSTTSAPTLDFNANGLSMGLFAREAGIPVRPVCTAPKN